MFWPINKKTVAVHSGNFHADDIFSVASLSLCLGYMPRIIRTRDEEKLKLADYVIDVGGEYDPAKNKFDHHQAGSPVRTESNIPYSSFGLVWKKFGEEICGSKEAASMIDTKLVAVTDADDNAFEISQGYVGEIRPYTIFDYVLSRNSVTDEKERDRTFKKMVIWAVEILQMEIKIAKRLLSDYQKVQATYLFSLDKKIIVLDGDYAWEGVLSKYPEPLFVVKPAINIKSWKVYAVKDGGSKFKNRFDLPESWGGKRGGELAKVTGVSDAIYCHHKRYMAIAGSKEGAMKMAELALAEADNLSTKLETSK